MLARARRYGAGPPEAGGAHVDHFATPRGGAPIDIRPELTDATAARRSGDARAPGVESSRATGVLRQAGCRGAVRAGPES